MPAKPQKAAMTPDDLKQLMAKAQVGRQADLADLVGVHRITVNRWLTGKTPISEALALLIRERLKNRTK